MLQSITKNYSLEAKNPVSEGDTIQHLGLNFKVVEIEQYRLYHTNRLTDIEAEGYGDDGDPTYYKYSLIVEEVKD